MTELAPFTNLEQVTIDNTHTNITEASPEAAREVVASSNFEIPVPGLPKSALDLGEAAVSHLLEKRVPHELTHNYNYKDNF